MKENKINKDLVESAVNYWSGFLKNPMGFVIDNGEPSQYALLNILVKSGAKSFPEEGIEKFEDILRNYIKNALELEGSGRVYLDVDYHPCRVLSSCLDQAFGERGYNSLTVFPCKTSMWVNDETVEVSQGYRAETKILFPIN